MISVAKLSGSSFILQSWAVDQDMPWSSRNGLPVYCFRPGLQGIETEQAACGTTWLAGWLWAAAMTMILGDWLWSSQIWSSGSQMQSSCIHHWSLHDSSDRLPWLEGLLGGFARTNENDLCWLNRERVCMKHAVMLIWTLATGSPAYPKRWDRLVSEPSCVFLWIFRRNS